MKKENYIKTPQNTYRGYYLLMMRLGVLFVVVLFYRAAKVHGRKQGEHIRLKKRYEKLKEVHEHREGNRNRADCEALENKDQREQAQDDDVTCRDVSEKSNHQGERLCQDTYHFNRDHDQQQWLWHARRIKDVRPVCFSAAEQSY